LVPLAELQLEKERRASENSGEANVASENDVEDIEHDDAAEEYSCIDNPDNDDLDDNEEAAIPPQILNSPTSDPCLSVNDTQAPEAQTVTKKIIEKKAQGKLKRARSLLETVFLCLL